MRAWDGGHRWATFADAVSEAGRAETMLRRHSPANEPERPCNFLYRIGRTQEVESRGTTAPRPAAASNLKICELGSLYFFLVAYVWHFSSGDYHRASQ